jgi:membrane associated rhomboid family serine protease
VAIGGTRSELPTVVLLPLSTRAGHRARRALESKPLAFLRPIGPRPASREPILNLPPATGVLLLANIGIHLVRQLLPQTLDDRIVASFGFIPARYTVTGGFGWEAVVSPVTYMLLHGSWLHLIVNMLALMAFGAGVERRIGGVRMVGFALLCGLAGAAVHAVVHPDSLDVVIGASGAISGLFGGVLRVLPGRRAGQGLQGLWLIIVVWIGSNVAFGLAGLPDEGSGEIAWVAHLGGFAAGLIHFGLFERRPRAGA